MVVRCIPLGQWEKAHALSNFLVKCGEYFYKIQSSEKKEEIFDTSSLHLDLFFNLLYI